MKDPNTSFKEMISTIAAQESQIRFTNFNCETAWELASTIRKLFAERYPDAKEQGFGLLVRMELFNGLKLLECVVGDGPITAPANLSVPALLDRSVPYTDTETHAGIGSKGNSMSSSDSQSRVCVSDGSTCRRELQGEL